MYIITKGTYVCELETREINYKIDLFSQINEQNKIQRREF